MNNNEQILSRMKEDILLRGLSRNTLESYTLNARIFLEYCNRPAEQLDEHDIRNFLLYLINEKKSSAGTVNNYSAAIRFLFAVTFNRTLAIGKALIQSPLFPLLHTVHAAFVAYGVPSI